MTTINLKDLSLPPPREAARFVQQRGRSLYRVPRLRVFVSPSLLKGVLGEIVRQSKVEFSYDGE